MLSGRLAVVVAALPPMAVTSGRSVVVFKNPLTVEFTPGVRQWWLQPAWQRWLTPVLQR